MSDDSSNGSAELLDVPSNEVARKRSPGKDEHERNRVEYSYIDNELFINEN